MRRYDDPVEVRKGLVGSGGSSGGSDSGTEGPEQFLWRGRLWKVRDVLAHWVETGPWWQSSGVHAVLGADAGDAGNYSGKRDADSRNGVAVRSDLLAEREVWRVEAGRGMAGTGIFDLVFDWSTGSWALTRCVD